MSDDITVSVTGSSSVTVDVAGTTVDTQVAVSGATAQVSVTQLGGDRGPKGDSGTFADAQAINARTANYTLLISDAGKLIAASHTSTQITLTVPAAAAVAFSLGTHIDVARLGAGAVVVSGASGVTVNGTPGNALRAQYSAATLIAVAADSWLLVGDLST